ncbi:hypothetical protein [Promicromonospora iranensis]|jgi:hypothetical protein|uniref:hypothetical protein n=1 Tax=Promicromonospora iranensis TaxID=1105144 RepID=UPI0023A94D6B|nr:hypothetical protein [Promicromonospora iranensis]
MSLWGPAAEAEIEYRRTELRKAWGDRRTSGADRADRAERRAERRSERTSQRRSERQVRADRAEQIREGIAGMRPASTGRRGLFA